MFKRLLRQGKFIRNFSICQRDECLYDFSVCGINGSNAHDKTSSIMYHSYLNNMILPSSGQGEKEFIAGLSLLEEQTKHQSKQESSEKYRVPRCSTTFFRQFCISLHCKFETRLRSNSRICNRYASIRIVTEKILNSHSEPFLRLFQRSHQNILTKKRFE